MAGSIEGAHAIRCWLSDLGAGRVLDTALGPIDLCPHLDWAASGAMMLTGGFAPALAPGPVLPMLRAVDGALRVLTARFGIETGIDPTTVLGARAGLRPLSRQGRTSVGGTSRLLETQDGWAVVSLARGDDLDAVPAMFGGDPNCDEPWVQLSEAAAIHATEDFVERIRLFGVPAAAVPKRAPVVLPPWHESTIGEPIEDPRLDGALVVDLSSLWAGPLCAQILGRAGARVVKVESVRRPDSARDGEPRFYDWLHAGQESVALDFAFADDRASVARLIESADFVIEASRPRALAQLGLAHDQLDLRPGVVWISITGHGRGFGDLVAFGDDAAAGGGLVARSGTAPEFCGDAIADPLTGVVAALAAVAARGLGGGYLLDLAMRDVAAAFAGADIGCAGDHPVEQRRKSWFVTCTTSRQEQRVLGPRVPAVVGLAPAMGADNDRWLSLLEATT